MKANLLGKVFGRLTVIGPAPNLKPGKPRWNCRCICGSEIIVTSNALLSANTRSCGCLSKEVKASLRKLGKKDLTGLSFNKLKVISQAGQRLTGKYTWLCQCECGRQKIIDGGNIVSGRTKSCGCLKKTSTTETQILRVYRIYERTAKKRGISFNLNHEEFRNLILQKCIYCHSIGQSYYDSLNGIDRLNSELGYFNENCVPCCSTCNYMKRSLSYANFIDHIKLIYSKIERE